MEPKIKTGMTVEVLDNECCGSYDEPGDVGQVTDVESDRSFLVKVGNTSWWHCHKCVRIIKKRRNLLRVLLNKIGGK